MRVAVIGGGLAGLAAATALAEQGTHVTVFEAAHHLGGRARGLEWNGTRIDNGQHILIGAYRETQRLMRLAGVDESSALLRLPLQLVQYGKFRMQAATWLPAPLHILNGILRAEGLSVSEKLSAVRFMIRLRLMRFRLSQDIPLAEFLAAHRQSDHLVRWLWEPLCLAALNTPLAAASTQVFLNVLRDSFSKGKQDSDLLLPRLDLSALLADPLGNYIRARGGETRLGVPVTAIDREVDEYIVQCGEESLRFTQVVLAVPAFRVSSLLARLPQLADTATICTSYDHQPIATVYLRYPEDVRLPLPMLGMTGGHTQWLIDRGYLDGQAGLISAVISADGPHRELSHEALAQAVIAEIAQTFPDLPPPLWHKVIIEKRATFECVPGMVRPAQKTALAGFYLAGDYTACDYPATIEGAVLSGLTCARHILTSRH